MAALPNKTFSNMDSSANFPQVSESMVLNFFYKSSASKVAEVKANAYSQRRCESDVVSCVCANRQNDECTLKSSVYVNLKGLQKFCTVVLSIDEDKHVINNLRCLSCAHGGCEHSLAFLKYLQKNSEKRVRNEESKLCTLKQKTSNRENFIDRGPALKKELSATTAGNKRIVNPVMQTVTDTCLENTRSYKDVKTVSGSFLKKNQLKEYQVQRKENLTPGFLPTKIVMSNTENIQDVPVIISNFKTKKPNNSNTFLKSNLAFGQLSSQFSSRGIHTAEGFLGFAKTKMTKSLCKLAEQRTRQQSENSLWHELRYGRITASKMHETSRCCKNNGSLVREILGLKKHYKNAYMQRGSQLEDEVFKEVLKLGYNVKKCGFFLHADYPYLGASPDGIGKDFILEIKCPSSEYTFEKYLFNQKITKKCKAQVLLQMLMTGKKKGLFCVAHYNFEYNRKIYIDWVDFDEEEMTELIEKVSTFWKNNIYPRLK